MESQRTRRTAIGLYLLVVSVYLLSGPGRIDIVDGQIRFEVADNLLRLGRPILTDPLTQRYGAVGAEGEIYAKYGPAASIAGLPLVALGALTDDPLGETRRFLFSWTSALLGALTAPLLFLLYRRLGVGRGAAVAWVLVAAFATLVWPLATSTFDQAQHAALILLVVYLALLAGQRDSVPLAAAAGLVAGLLLNYQENYLLLFPFLALPMLDGGGDRRRILSRFAAFAALTLVGVGLWMLYNQICFQNPFIPGKLRPGLFPHPSGRGNALAGLGGLLVSPGKSVLLYSPTIVLGLLGWRLLKGRAEWLAGSILLVSIVHLLFISLLAFWHGDWCWGPRYLVILLPLWAIAFPFAVRTPGRRRLAIGLVAVGVVVQLLGLSLVHERFFHERALGGMFWAGDTGFYYRESALLSRPGEIWETLSQGVPETARHFSNTAGLEGTTEFIRGFGPPESAPDLMRHFQVFYLPRPWPLWIPRLDPERYVAPVRTIVWVPALLMTGLIGGLLVFRGRRPPAVRS